MKEISKELLQQKAQRGEVISMLNIYPGGQILNGRQTIISCIDGNYVVPSYSEIRIDMVRSGNWQHQVKNPFNEPCYHIYYSETSFNYALEAIADATSKHPTQHP
jgi:hypothetical protein